MTSIIPFEQKSICFDDSELSLQHLATPLIIVYCILLSQLHTSLVLGWML